MSQFIKIFVRITCLSLAAFAVSFIIAGCNATGSYTSHAVYDKEVVFGKIAQKAADYEGVKRNPVIVIHGFMGGEVN